MSSDYSFKNAWPEWEILEEIGHGSYGSVYRARRVDLAGTAYAAIKATRIPVDEGEVTALQQEGLSDAQSRTYFEDMVRDYSNEIRLMSKVRGYTNIVTIEDHRIYAYPDRLRWDIFIRMELLKPLNDYLRDRAMPEAEVIRLGVDLCTALEVCHRRSIIHRDIKPENVFINEEGIFKLGDFGVSRTLERHTNHMSRKGTYNYMAPEVFNGTLSEADFQSAVRVDLYSLGLMLYRLSNGNRLPFIPNRPDRSPQDYQNALARRMSGEALPMPENASSGLARVILRACDADPRQRYRSATEMKEALLALNRRARPAVSTPVDATVRMEDEPPARGRHLRGTASPPREPDVARTGASSAPQSAPDSQASPDAAPLSRRARRENAAKATADLSPSQAKSKPTASAQANPRASADAADLPSKGKPANNAQSKAQAASNPPAKPSATNGLSSQPVARRSGAAPSVIRKTRRRPGQRGIPRRRALIALCALAVLLLGGVAWALLRPAPASPAAKVAASATPGADAAPTAGADVPDEPDGTAADADTAERTAAPTAKPIASGPAATLAPSDVIGPGRIVQFGESTRSLPIDWIVLDADGDKALLLSYHALRALPFNSAAGETTWAECSLRGVLNDQFLNGAFSARERDAILQTDIHTPDNPLTGTPGGADTQDRIFLLSVEEAAQYAAFIPNCPRTDDLREQHSGKDATLPENAEAFFANWYTRTPGAEAGTVCYINGIDPDARHDNCAMVDNADIGVRPAMWVDVKLLKNCLGPTKFFFCANDVDHADGYSFQEEFTAETNGARQSVIVNAIQLTIPYMDDPYVYAQPSWNMEDVVENITGPEDSYENIMGGSICERIVLSQSTFDGFLEGFGDDISFGDGIPDDEGDEDTDEALDTDGPDVFDDYACGIITLYLPPDKALVGEQSLVVPIHDVNYRFRFRLDYDYDDAEQLIWNAEYLGCERVNP